MTIPFGGRVTLHESGMGQVIWESPDYAGDCYQE
jgi:hypothetical protein